MKAKILGNILTVLALVDSPHRAAAQTTAFNYPGRDDKTISTLEADGVALAANQGLNQKLTEELQRRDTENGELKQRLEKLEHLINHENRGAR